jgi:hypothetical protein
MFQQCYCVQQVFRWRAVWSMPEQYYYTGMKAVSGSVATYSPTDLRVDVAARFLDVGSLVSKG